jgi:hypothetical protein
LRRILDPHAESERAARDRVDAQQPPTHERVVSVLHRRAADRHSEPARDPQDEHPDDPHDLEGEVADHECEQPHRSEAAGQEEIGDGRGREQQGRDPDEDDAQRQRERGEHEAPDDAWGEAVHR